MTGVSQLEKWRTKKGQGLAGNRTQVSGLEVQYAMHYTPRGRVHFNDNYTAIRSRDLYIDLIFKHNSRFMFKLQHWLVNIYPGDTLLHSDSCSRDRARIHPLQARSSVFNHSFYPKMVRDWNHLPVMVTDNQLTGRFYGCSDIFHWLNF